MHFEWLFLVYCTRTCTCDMSMECYMYMYYIFQHLKCMHDFNFNIVIDRGLLMKYFFLHDAFKVATGSFVVSGRCLNQNVMHCVFS